jgi:hypothetical protein
MIESSLGSVACTNAASVIMLMPQAMEKKEIMEGRVFIGKA